MAAQSATSPDCAPDCATGGLPASVPPASALSPPSPPSPPLPPLSPADRPLLARLLALNENYQALAAELASTDHALAAHLSAITAAITAAPPVPAATSSLMPDAQCPMPSDLLSLYAWSEQPHIAAWIACHHSRKDQQRREAALAALESIVKAPDNKAEQRRAATTLLRALDHTLSRLAPPAWPARPASGRPGCPPPPGRASPRLISEAHLKYSPSAVPDHAHTPTDLAAIITKDLGNDFCDQALCTIEALLAPGSPLADPTERNSRVEPLASLSAQAQISDPAPFTPLPAFAEGRQLTITDAPTSTSLTLRFTRTHQGPWRLFDLNSG